MRSSYREEDVKILLKDITGIVRPQPTEERERLIQSGRHYSEMLPVEYVPSPAYMEAYREALAAYAGATAEAVAALADRVRERRGREVTLVSLARAGIPIGILLKRRLKQCFSMQVPHYAVSIIRDRGMDDNAMRYILDRHPAGTLLFVDGWIGKGAIAEELRRCVRAYPGVSPELAVAADPAGITELCGTHEDILIPSSCLNSTVSGLISRTFLREDVIGAEDFHGAVYYGELSEADLSYEFIHTIEREFPKKQETGKKEGGNIPEAEKQVWKDRGMDEVREIAARFGISNLHFVKPGIGETTRVLLRRVPWKVLIGAGREQELAHIRRLAQERGVDIVRYPLRHYKACGIIRKMDDL